MNKYNVYTVFTYVNVTEVTARNEKSAVNKIREMAETTNIFSQKIPSLSQTYMEDITSSYHHHYYLYKEFPIS